MNLCLLLWLQPCITRRMTALETIPVLAGLATTLLLGRQVAEKFPQESDGTAVDVVVYLLLIALALYVFVYFHLLLVQGFKELSKVRDHLQRRAA